MSEPLQRELYDTSYKLKVKGLDPSLKVRSRLLLNTETPKKTKMIGRLLGKLLQEGDVIALYGNLGSGKTCLIQGIASGAGVKEKYITSPTFIMINEYRGRMSFYHIDLYRLGPSDLEGLGFRDYISTNGVTVIEWAERSGDELPEERLSVHLKITGNRSREIIFEGKGERYIKLIKILTERIHMGIRM